MISGSVNELWKLRTEELPAWKNPAAVKVIQYLIIAPLKQILDLALMEENNHFVAMTVGSVLVRNVCLLHIVKFTQVKDYSLAIIAENVSHLRLV